MQCRCLPPAPRPQPLRRRRSGWRIGWLLCLGLLWLAPWASAARNVTIHTAQAVASDSTAFPADQPAPLVDLPDEWAVSRPGSAGPVWYRLSFTAPGAREQAELLALYIERVCSRLEVYLNGQLLHSGGQMREPITQNCDPPRLIGLPAALIGAGLNTLDLKVAGHALTHVASSRRAGGLSALQIGPQSLLEPVHARQMALSITLPQALGAAVLLIGGALLVLAWRYPAQRHQAWFGALTVGWAVAEAPLWLRALPWSGAAAELLQCAMLALLTLAAVQALLRRAHIRRRWVDLALTLQCVALPAALWLAGPERVHAVASVWLPLLALQVLTAALLYLRAQVWQHGRGAWRAALWLGIAAAALALAHAAPAFGPPSLAAPLARSALSLLIALAGLHLLLQPHGKAQQSAADDKADLELRIREATAEIERNFNQLAELRVEKVTERERKRIAADLHDDLGAKLLTIVHTSESERISTLAREALEEMRLSVRGLTGKPVHLIDALGDWRAEVVARLGQAGIETDWSAPTEDLPQTLSARAFVQTTRILREAVSNVIKHSGATHCSLSCALAEGDVQIIVRDNGNGIPMELDGRLDRGHGMASMKHRAKQLQGQCLVESGPGYGTVIRLTLPLDRATEAA